MLVSPIASIIRTKVFSSPHLLFITIRDFGEEGSVKDVAQAFLA